MKLFTCQTCGNAVYFDNTQCVKCKSALGYLPQRFVLSALETADGAWKAKAEPNKRFRACANAGPVACNWVIDEDDPNPFCLACRHNRTVPDASFESNVANWRKLEAAKRHLFYSLTRWGLPIPVRPEDPAGLAFDFLSGAGVGGDGERVMTGHDNGLITIDIAEADDAEREKRRTAMNEPYRTMLGHFRHEIGHFYWDRLVRDDPRRLEEFRNLFGDERADYGQALQRHYRDGAPPDWPTRFISAYASTHPWEDFAESWAHHMHMVDTLETAHAFGISVSPREGDTGLHAHVDFDPYREKAFAPVVPDFVALIVAVNSLNRSLGLNDIYPFVFTRDVIDKLAFIHDLVNVSRKTSAPAARVAEPALN